MKHSLLSTLLATLVSIAAFGQVRTFPFDPKVTIDPQKIDIVRDSYGIPHIFAKTDPEVAYGLMWAAAEDDFDTMQFLLMASKARMGVHSGAEGAQIDYAVQLMGIHEHVEKHYAAEVPEDFKRLLEASCMAANAYAAAHPEEVWYMKAFPVTPQEIIIGYMLGQSLMAGVDGVIRGIMEGSYTQILKNEYNDTGIGSNAYAIHSSLSGTGETYLAINSHQPITGILSWYEAHVCSEEGWNIHGSLFHGGVSIFHGTNEHLAWAHTTGDLDMADVYHLQMHPRKKNWYMFDGQWHRLETKRAKLKVGLGKKKNFRLNITKKYWWSKYGPTLVTRKHGTFSFRMPTLFELGPAEQWYRMNKATNFTEFYKALEMQGISMQNITYADKNDTIFFIANGKVPRRDPRYDWEQVLPGNTSATLWTEFLREDELVQSINPSCGYLFNTNNSIFDHSCTAENPDCDRFPVSIGYRPDKKTNRGIRIQEIFDGLSQVDYAKLKEIKFDVQFPDTFVFLKDFSIADMLHYTAEDAPDLADVFDHFRAWNRRGDTTNVHAALIFTTFYMVYNDNSVSAETMRDSAAVRKQVFLKHMRAAKERFIKHFGRIDVPLGEVQVLSRGGREYAVAGGPDAIRAVYCNLRDDGKLEMWLGDGFVQMTRFANGKAIMESVNAYGASNKPSSLHYNDQMGMFVQQRFKPNTLDKAQIYRDAERVYHPGQ
ncbi:MAG: penicillin acylase family protein [Flavobacteriales bacterium]|nr:penicillin acylase family protein [Flavobacteriales bacterium]